MGYINISAEVSIDDIMDEIDNECLMKEVKDRGLIFKKDINSTSIEDYKTGEFRDTLCDILSLGYRASTEEIIERIREIL